MAESNRESSAPQNDKDGMQAKKPARKANCAIVGVNVGAACGLVAGFAVPIPKSMEGSMLLGAAFATGGGVIGAILGALIDRALQGGKK